MQESTCQKDETDSMQRVRLVDYKKEKKRKKDQAMTSYLKAEVNMPTLRMTCSCTSFLIAHALLHSGACWPGRGGGIWL